MADFGAQATSLSAPQGAGAEVQNPVKEQVVGTQIPDQLIGAAVDIFATGLKNQAKQAELDRKNAVVKGYVDSETNINNAVATGQIDSASAAARSRANFNKYAASHSEYIEDLQKAGNALKGFTEKGTVEDDLKAQAVIRAQDIQQAQQRGFTFSPGMPKEAVDSQIRASQAGIRAEREYGELVKRNTEARAQGTFDQHIADRQEKDLSFRAVNDIAGANLDAFGSLGSSLAAGVKAGTLDPQLAAAQLAERFSHINGAIQAAARVNPEIAAPYRTLFNDMNTVYTGLLKPGADVEALENQLKVMKTKAQILALQDPNVLAGVTVSNLFGNNPSLDLTVSKYAVGTLTKLAQILPGDNVSYAPQLVGNPEAEKDSLKLLKGYAAKLNDPKIANKEGFKREAGNATNQILKQTGAFLDNGASPEKLRDLADFFASPEYANLVTSGVIDKQAAQAAAKTFQLKYEPAIINGVQQKLKASVGNQSVTTFDSQGRPVDSQPVDNAKTAKDVVDIKFTGAGIVFEPKAGVGADARKQQQDTVRDLQTAQKGINQLIHIGAHMAGTTDYGKYWEDNKHIFLPDVYSKYKGLEIGDIKNGMRYKGGEANDAKSWEKVNGAGK